MREYLKFFIDGAWVDPVGSKILPVENPATETVCGFIALGSAADVDKAVLAARAAFPSWSQATRDERIDVLERIVSEYRRRAPDLAAAITEEMGAPAVLAERAQVGNGLGHLLTAIEILKSYQFEQDRGSTRIVKEPIGVCALITPWNWPLNQITSKVAPALATGCTMVLKPSEVAPFSGQIFAEILDAAGVPPGVFNLIHGDGVNVGVPLTSHPEVDMVSFTGSTRAGILVATNAAPTVKRVAQELGGKSANIVVDDSALASSVKRTAIRMMSNSGQTCVALTRMIVPNSRMDEVINITRDAVSNISVGDPHSGAQMGPVASREQWTKIQELIQAGIDENATLVTGGPGRPDGIDRGYYVQPTVFANVTNDMRVAREEIFGPVLSIIGYETVDEAIKIANDTEYGLGAAVQAESLQKAREIASQLRAGRVWINDGDGDRNVPFGGYKMSGNGREWGEFGFAEYLEVKAILGFQPKN